MEGCAGGGQTRNRIPLPLNFKTPTYHAKGGSRKTIVIMVINYNNNNDLYSKTLK